MKRIVTGPGLEETGEETGDRVAELREAEKKWEGAMTPDNNSTEGNRKRKETVGSISSEDRDTVIESEVEHGTEWEDTRSRQLMIYVHEHSSLQRTDTRRTRMVQWQMSWI